MSQCLGNSPAHQCASTSACSPIVINVFIFGLRVDSPSDIADGVDVVVDSSQDANGFAINACHGGIGTRINVENLRISDVCSLLSSDR